jgi:hypothetical protein
MPIIYTTKTNHHAETKRKKYASNAHKTREKPGPDHKYLVICYVKLGEQIRKHTLSEFSSVYVPEECVYIFMKDHRKISSIQAHNNDTEKIMYYQENDT